MLNRFAPIYLSVLIYSCSTPPESAENYFTEKDLPEAIQLKGNKLNFQKITNPRGIYLQDGCAFVFERKNVSDDKFHIIDLKNNRYIQSKGIDGMGPGEVSVISQIEGTSSKDKIWTFDPELLTYSRFDIHDTSRLAEDQLKVPATAFYLTSVTWTSDSTLIGNTVDGWTKYLHLSQSGDTLALFGSWKDMIQGREFPRGVKAEELDANLVSNLFQGSIRISPDKKHLIKVGMNVDFIDIVDLETKEINTL